MYLETLARLVIISGLMNLGESERLIRGTGFESTAMPKK
jgi:hypothetical protein